MNNGTAHWRKTDSEPRLDLDTILRAVNHSYRRHTLLYLNVTNEPQPVADVAAAVCEELEQYSDSDRQRIALALRHQHLPLLGDAGLVEWTPRGLIESTGITSDAVRLIQNVPKYFE